MTDILVELLARYVNDGRLFFAAHLVCVIFVVYLVYELDRERRRLREWLPTDTDSDAPPHSIARLFDQFVKSVRQMGPKGGTADVGEHLQRIQDAVSRRETHLSDAIHWLLLIGIAGTLFGLFEFAFKVAALAPDQIAANVGRILSEAMAKAFPVGFVGVGLLVFFQGVASFIEKKLDEAVGAATGRALDYRREQTVAETDFIDAVQASISSSMQPLQDLGGLLENSLQPVIQTFATRLDDSLSLVRTQMDEMRRYAGQISSVEREFVNAASQVRSTVESLQEFSLTINERLDTVQAESAALQRQSDATIRWSEALIKLSQAQQERIQQLQTESDVTLTRAAEMQDKVFDLVENLERAGHHVSALPVVMAETVRTSVPNLVETASARLLGTWDDSTRQMAASLAATTQNAVAPLVDDLQRVEVQLRSTLDEWGRAASNVEGLIKDAITTAIQVGTAENQRLLTESSTAVKSWGQELHAWGKDLVTARATTVQQFETALQRFDTTLERFCDSLSDSPAAFREAAGELRSAAGEWRAVFEKLTVATDSVLASDVGIRGDGTPDVGGSVE